MNNNFNEMFNLTITANNSISFDLLNFNLSILFDKLSYFYISNDIGNYKHFAYPFDEYKLLCKKFVISGYINNFKPLYLINSGILNNEDLEFFNSIELMKNMHIYINTMFLTYILN